MMSIAVMVMAEEVSKRLSIVGPGQLTQRISTAQAPTDDAKADTVRKVKFETQKDAEPSQSTPELSTTPVDSIKAHLVLESAKITLYWGTTELVCSPSVLSHVQNCLKQFMMWPCGTIPLLARLINLGQRM